MATASIEAVAPASFARVAFIFLYGVLLTFPVLLPGGVAGLRATELANGMALAMLVMGVVHDRSITRAILSLLMVAALSVFWIFNELVDLSLHIGTVPARMILVRWLMSIPAAYWLAILMRHRRDRMVVAYGLLMGLAASLGTVCYDHWFFSMLTYVPDPFAEQSIAYLDETRRAQGIFSHPNAAAGTVLLAVPLIIGLIEERRLPQSAILLAAAAIGLVFITTETRGPTAFCILLIGWHYAGRSRFRALFLVSLMVTVILGAAYSNHQPGAIRGDLLGRALDTGSGSDEREKTIESAFAIAFDHPLGVASRYEIMLEKTTGFRATHNGWAQLAMLGGWPLMVFVGYCCVRQARFVMMNHAATLEAWLAAYIIGALLFENQFFVPTFSVFCLWLTQPPHSLEELSFA